jgi:hypothetical protein
MTAMIKKPDANPIAAAALTWLLFHTGHMIINGQQRKTIFTLVATVVGGIFCFFPGLVVAVLSILDAYQTATRLQAGEEIGENEYTNPMLFKVISFIDKTATCNNA